MSPTLRLFAGPPDAPPPSVTVTLGELLAACGVETGEDAPGRVWLSDFAAEPLLVTPDLADLLYAARAMTAGPTPPGAAPARRAA